jgi:uncharacterized protein (DUF362 family)
MAKDSLLLPMKRLTRRQWLLLGGGSVGLLAVAGGVGLTKRWGLIESLGAKVQTMPDHRVSEAGGQQLSIVHGSSPEQNVRAALEALGGLRRFVSAKDRVLIKPNIAWDRSPEQAATTDPRVVAEVVRACRDAGVEQLRVMDCPVDDPVRTYRSTRILDAARDAGAQVLLPKDTGYAHVLVPGHTAAWPIRDAFLWADKLINVPIAKHHGGSKLTAGMKNWIGITDKRRELFHASLDESIVALAELMKPTLTIIDATRILLRNGPRGGNLDDVRAANTVVASLDPVAADAWACELLEFPIDKVAYLRRAAQRGLGRIEWRQLPHQELRLG